MTLGNISNDLSDVRFNAGDEFLAVTSISVEVQLVFLSTGMEIHLSTELIAHLRNAMYQLGSLMMHGFYSFFAMSSQEGIVASAQFTSGSFAHVPVTWIASPAVLSNGSDTEDCFVATSRKRCHTVQASLDVSDLRCSTRSTRLEGFRAPIIGSCPKHCSHVKPCRAPSTTEGPSLLAISGVSTEPVPPPTPAHII